MTRSRLNKRRRRASKKGFVTRRIAGPSSVYPDVLYTSFSYTIPVNLSTASVAPPAVGTGHLRDAGGNCLSGCNPVHGAQVSVGPNTYERSSWVSELQEKYLNYYCYKSRIQLSLQNHGQGCRVHIIPSQLPLPLTVTGDNINSMRDANSRWQIKSRHLPQPGNGMAPVMKMSMTCDYMCTHGITRERARTDPACCGNMGVAGSLGTPPVRQWEWNVVTTTDPEGNSTSAQVIGTMRVTHWVRLFGRAIFDDALVQP